MVIYIGMLPFSLFSSKGLVRNLYNMLYVPWNFIATCTEHKNISNAFFFFYFSLTLSVNMYRFTEQILFFKTAIEIFSFSLLVVYLFLPF